MEFKSPLNVIMDDFSTHPMCPHGPTLLFHEKKGNSERKFFACAACRDRKLCNFFHLADEKFSERKKEIWELERQKFMSQLSHKEIYSTVISLANNVLNGEVDYCHSCSKFILNSEASQHLVHDLHRGVSYHQFTHPTELLKPLESSKKEAQYLFSKSSVQTIVSIAKGMNITSLICIGAPRIHEYIKTEENKMNSILLDFDRRFHMFYKPREFCWYNSFNNHFFLGDSSKKWCTKFLQRNEGKNLMIIMDPPFGGRIEPLAKTIEDIQDLHKKLNANILDNIPVILISPYFMEPHVVASLPQYAMTDYKVSYNNHPLFSKGSRGKRGSPVRIFTNISITKIVLPKEEGYRFCKKCNRWVSQENQHCDLCMTCPSKNGSTYVHCFKCQTCVKPSWSHCGKCKRCVLEPHSCNLFVVARKCYSCGQTGHKKYDCPEKNMDKESADVENRSKCTKRKKASSVKKLKKSRISSTM